MIFNTAELIIQQRYTTSSFCLFVCVFVCFFIFCVIILFFVGSLNLYFKSCAASYSLNNLHWVTYNNAHTPERTLF